MTELLTKFFEGGEHTMEPMRTMAFQIPEDLFQRLKQYLSAESARTGKKLSQKDFVLGLLQRALDEAEAAKTVDNRD